MTDTLYIETPYVESRALSVRVRREVWLKMEALQPCGSFKARGIAHACMAHQRRGARRFVTSSGGNAGLAAAWAGNNEGEALYPLDPGGPRQREMALRAGVNIVMYTLTGNYKADQVHVPELLERLGH